MSFSPDPLKETQNIINENIKRLQDDKRKEREKEQREKEMYQILKRLEKKFLTE